MVAIARGQENTTSLINWFISVNCVLTDAFEVGFQVWDISGGLPGTQVFPATPGDWEVVTDAPGKFSVGSYYAYDNGNAQGWTPGIAEPLGTHQIKWRWKITAGSPYQSNLEEFEVLVESAGSSADYYCSVQDVRDAGVTEAQADDAAVLASIKLWQQVLDRACRQWFNYKTLTLTFDGNDSDTIFFGVPIVQITSLKINDDTADLATTLYKVYSGRETWPDDRRNPRIKLVRNTTNIFSGYTDNQMMFRRGRQNQVVSGIFGYTESDGTTPEPIRHALCRLVTQKLLSPAVPTASSPLTYPPILGPLLEEWTDGHKVKFAQAGGQVNKRRSGLTGLIQDPEVLDIITLYRAPVGVATPTDWRF